MRVNLITTLEIYAAVETLTTGSWIDSFHVSGSTVDGEGDPKWNHDGSSFPSGSYLTSSLVETIKVNNVPLQNAFQLKTSEGDEIVCAEKSILVYDTGSDELCYKVVDKIVNLHTNSFINNDT